LEEDGKDDKQDGDGDAKDFIIELDNESVALIQQDKAADPSNVQQRMSGLEIMAMHAKIKLVDKVTIKREALMRAIESYVKEERRIKVLDYATKTAKHNLVEDYSRFLTTGLTSVCLRFLAELKAIKETATKAAELDTGAKEATKAMIMRMHQEAFQMTQRRKDQEEAEKSAAAAAEEDVELETCKAEVEKHAA
jgi:NACalpha-BTF3-like transcription factor